jgi:hypothetical protein
VDPPPFDLALALELPFELVLELAFELSPELTFGSGAVALLLEPLLLLGCDVVAGPPPAFALVLVVAPPLALVLVVAPPLV